MQNQYLIVAENIIYKNKKLTCINIFDQFVAVHLPAEFNFDLVFMCGPGWDAGEYNVTIKAKTNEVDLTEIGRIKVTIPDNKFIYNALAPNLRMAFGENVNTLTFMVYRNEDLVLERNYPVNSLLVLPKEQLPQESQTV